MAKAKKKKSIIKKKDEEKDLYLSFKFKLRPTRKQEQAFTKFVGHARFVYNNFIFTKREDYDEYVEEVESRLIWMEASNEEEARKLTYNQFLNKYTYNYALDYVKEKYPFLKEAPSQALQQKSQDLFIAFQRHFDHITEYPVPKKKGVHDTFRIPQHFEFDEKNSRVKLPKVGWVRYRKSRDLPTKASSITIIKEADGWYMSVLCNMGKAPKTDNADMSTAIGIDMGVKRFYTTSEGEFAEDLQILLKPIDEQIVRSQKRIKNKVQGSKRLAKAYKKLARLHKKKANIRNDFIQKASTQLVKNHDVICVEDLCIKNMTKSAKGTVSKPGRNVRQKSGLNRAILNQGWGEFLFCLEYKLALKGGILERVSPQYTSQTCPICGHVSKDNRKTQAEFKCVHCGNTANADSNAAQNILLAGLASIAREANSTDGNTSQAVGSANPPKLICACAG